MNRAALLAVVLNFVIIGGLPVFFFRRDGKLNLMWWLTGGPFFICPLVLLGAHIGVVPISPLFSTLLGPYQDLLAVPFSLASLAPRHIVTYGAYRFIRHPFYSSFLLAFAAAALLLPHPVIVAFALYVLLILNLTAAGEEKKLRASELGSEYQAYMMRTGRFFPRWGRSS
ncbi:MAG: hypothetical protein DMG10_01235 [Acidobacteria bacterium]|nr:MAG: hypothetical protein DMG10_01235 [Acidobacteriota bacterium]